ncbi:MAG: MMPL family transporter [Bacteriovoracaceae bacterium]|nr:MMPL family transporter [Bacteriovoracaceae bacterium]
MTNKIITKYLNLIRNYPKLLIGLTILSILGLSLGLVKFNSKNDVRIWFEENDPKLDTLNYLEKTFGNDETLVIVVHLPDDRSGDLFRSDRMEIIHNITTKAWKIPQVIRVESLTNYNYVSSIDNDINVEPLIGENFDPQYLLSRRSLALSDESIKGYLIDEKAHLALIFAHLIPSNVQTLRYKDIVKEARSILAEYSNDELEFHITGKASLNHAFEEVSMGDVKLIMPLLFILLVAYLFYVFRSFKAMLLPFFIVLTCVTATLGLGFWIGLHFSAILAILPIILVAIGIADSVHIMVNFFQFRGRGETTEKAIELTIHKNFVPTFLTSFSTSVGLFSLMTTKLVPIKHLGLLAGIGCMVAWFFTIFLLIPLISIISYKVPPIFFKEDKDETVHRLPALSLAFIKKWRIPISLFFLVASIYSAYLGMGVTTNADPDSYFSKESKIGRANEVVKKYIGGSAGPDLILEAGGPDKAKSPEFLNKVSQFNDWLRSLAPVNNTVSILDILKKMNQVINNNDPDFYKIPDSQEQVAQYLFLYTLSLPPGMDINDRISLDYSATRISLLWTVYDTTNWAIYRDKMKAKAKELGLSLTIAGKANLFQDMIDYVVETFIRSIVMAMIFVSICLMIFFRSIKIGLISLIPNILPLTFGAATMALFDMDLNLGTSLVASVCLGIAVDDTIHFLANYFKNKEEGMSQEDNILKIFTYTGSALIITTLILSSAFGLYVFGDFLPNVNFGILCSITLLLALIVDLVFLPAFLLVIDKKSVKG